MANSLFSWLTVDIYTLIIHLVELFFGMHMKNMNIWSKNVMRYGHILRQDLRPFGELKFLNFLFYRLIFLLMRLNFYLSVSVIKELLQFSFQFYFQNQSTFNNNS